MCYDFGMRYLGIDFGSKRVGLALSDESGSMAFPHKVIDNDGNLLNSVLEIIENEKIESIVIGHSVDNEGKDNPIHTATKEFITDLTLETGLPVHLEEEQFSTQEAIRLQGRNDKTDASAATVILNSYLSKQK